MLDPRRRQIRHGPTEHTLMRYLLWSLASHSWNFLSILLHPNTLNPAPSATVMTRLYDPHRAKFLLAFLVVFRPPFLLAFQYHDSAFARYDTGFGTGAGVSSRVMDALRMELVGKIGSGQWSYPSLMYCHYHGRTTWW